MLRRVDMLRSSQGQRLNSRWTHSLKSANSIIQRSKERVVYRESQVQVASGSYSVGEERKMGMIACKGYYDRRKWAMQYLFATITLGWELDTIILLGSFQVEMFYDSMIKGVSKKTNTKGEDTSRRCN